VIASILAFIKLFHLLLYRFVTCVSLTFGQSSVSYYCTYVLECERSSTVDGLESLTRPTVLSATYETVEVVTDLLNRRASGPQNTGAPKRRNHAGNKSRPVDVNTHCRYYRRG